MQEATDDTGATTITIRKAQLMPDDGTDDDRGGGVCCSDDSSNWR